MTTIARVAALAGVGVGTVSRVLNDSGAVSAATRRRVEEAIDALGYEPSAAARALSTGRTMSIGVVAPFLTQSSVVERLRGVARRVADADYRLVLLDVEHPERLLDSVGSFAVHGRVDGLLVISLALPAGFRAGQRADRARRPPQRRAAERLDRRRGRRPARHRAPARARPHAHRLRRRRRGQPLRLRLQRAPPRRLRGGAARRRRRARPGARAHRAARPRPRARARARAARLGGRPPTAIFAASDDQALGVLEAAEATSVSVPDRLSVVGFDDLEVARYARLTTVAQPLEASGARGVDLLLDALAGGSPRSERTGLRARRARHHRARGPGDGERTRGKAPRANAAAQWHDANVP